MFFYTTQNVKSMLFVILIIIKSFVMFPSNQMPLNCNMKEITAFFFPEKHASKTKWTLFALNVYHYEIIIEQLFS